MPSRHLKPFLKLIQGIEKNSLFINDKKIASQCPNLVQ
jgi:hypothetical protein